MKELLILKITSADVYENTDPPTVVIAGREVTAEARAAYCEISVPWRTAFEAVSVGKGEVDALIGKELVVSLRT